MDLVEEMYLTKVLIKKVKENTKIFITLEEK